jgi:hypothetical protein
MDELARQEKDLYPAIQKLMENRRYTVICQFKTFFPLTGRTRILDLLGFRWTDDGDLDAWAIEGKQGASPGDTLTALGQAIEYQLYVPRVSRRSPGSDSGLGIVCVSGNWCAMFRSVFR